MTAADWRPARKAESAGQKNNSVPTTKEGERGEKNRGLLSAGAHVQPEEACRRPVMEADTHGNTLVQAGGARPRSRLHV